ncbi:MAG: VCBS repeat-containing protein [Planctomycetes bacterium]|nr:VCBS repeat-containing protein [Planctomycetota bacterium]
MSTNSRRYLYQTAVASVVFTVSAISTIANPAIVQNDPVYNGAATHKYAGPQSLALADFNEDGIPDVAAIGIATKTVGLLFGTGAGTFAPVVQVSVPFTGLPFILSVMRMTTADFNGDGHADLAIVANDGESFVLLNDGAAHFTITDSFVYDSKNPAALAAADVDEDGIPDLLTCDGGEKDISVRLGNGAGSFGAPAYFAADNNYLPQALAVADVDGDGHMDVAVQSMFSIYLFHGDGHGAFAVSSTISLGGTFVHGFAAADFDTSGSVDFAHVSYSVNNLFINNGTGTFTNTPLLSNPATALGVADLNNDQIPDLMVGGTANGVATFASYLNSPAGSFTLAGQSPLAGSGSNIFAADMNGDGNADAVFSNGSDIIILTTDGNGNFRNRTSVQHAGSARNVFVTDLNGDNRPDVVAYDAVTGVVVEPFINNGDGTFSAAPTASLVGSFSGFTLADFDGDGYPDYAASLAPTNKFQVGFGAGDGSFPSFVQFGDRPQTVAVAAADIDGDGDTDIITLQGPIGSISLSLNDGTGAFVSSGFKKITKLGTAVRVADFNNDGFLDIVVTHKTPMQITAILGSPTGLIAPRKFALTKEPSSMEVGDLNMDGDPDLVVSSVDGYVSVFKGNYLTTFEPEMQFSVDPSILYLPISALAIADANGDGKPEVALASANAQRIYIFRGDGAGNILAPQWYVVGSSPVDLKFGDFDIDGHMDLVTTDIGEFTILTNQVP